MKLFQHDAYDMLHINQSQVNSARPKDLKRLQWSHVWTTVRMNRDRESLLPRRQMSQMVKLLNFTSNCQFTVQIGIFVRGAVIAYSLCSRFMAKDSRSEKMNHFIFISRALIGWDGSFLILLYPQQARNQFSSSVFHFLKFRINRFLKLKLLIFNKQNSENPRVIYW